MPTIKETRNQMVQLVFPEHTNNLGTLHGGRLMDWIMLIGTIASSKLAKGITVLGTTDSIDFINPVRAGEIVILDSWVEYVGRSSIEVGVKVHTENPETGEQKLTTASHLAFIAVEKDGKPRRILEGITPADELERRIFLDAQKRRESRLSKLAQRREERTNNTGDEVEIAKLKLDTTRPVLPEDTFYGNFMSVGKLMKGIDETSAILGGRFVRGTVVTGSLDELYFYSPIRVGEVIILRAGITYAGKTSLEVGIKVLSEDLTTGEHKHTCTAFLSFVHLGKDGKPQRIPEFNPETEDELRLWRQAEARKKRRKERIKEIKKFAESFLQT